MREWKREDCVSVCTSVCVFSVPCVCLMLHVGVFTEANMAIGPIWQRHVCCQGKTQGAYKKPFTFCFLFHHVDRGLNMWAEKLAAPKNAVPCWVSVFRTSATISSKCLFPETMTLCSSAVPTASTPCADTTGSVSSAGALHAQMCAKAHTHTNVD